MRRRLTRRTLLGGAAGSALAASLPLPAIAETNPIRIGLLTIKTGPLASAGIQMEQGTVLFLKGREHTLAGRKAELIIAETSGNPAGAKTKAQELIERDRVDMIFGPWRRSSFSRSATTSPGKRSRCSGSQRPRT